MKMYKLLLVNRLWGFSLGVFAGTISIDKPLWVSIIITIPVVYFLLFGDSHFRK